MASKKNRPQNKSATISGLASRDRFFNISVKLIPTKETFEIKKVSNEMKISELKKEVEFASGIPYHMQRLCYLDEGDLLEHTNVRHNDIIPGAILHLDLWSEWRSLIEAIAANDTDAVMRLGVTHDTRFSTPHSSYLGKAAKEKWIENRAFTALYIASHRGYMKMVNRLIEKGADVNGRTNAGRTPLHVAAAQGHGTVVDVLLEKGADIDAEDKFSDSALAIASKYGHKGCERHLFLFRWRERAKSMKPHKERGLFAHQHYDSSLPTWLNGNQAQLYMANINDGLSLKEGAPAFDNSDNSEAEKSPEKSNAPQEHRHRHAEGRPGSVMSAIQEEMSNRSGTPASPMKEPEDSKNDSFQAWLKRKQKTEQIILDQKKQEEDKRKLQEDDRLRAESEKERSYEQWLNEKAEAKHKPNISPTKPQNSEQKKPKKQTTVSGIIQEIVTRRQQEAS